MEDGGSRGRERLLDADKSKKTGLSLESLERIQPCWHLNVSPARLLLIVQTKKMCVVLSH